MATIVDCVKKGTPVAISFLSSTLFVSMLPLLGLLCFVRIMVRDLGSCMFHTIRAEDYPFIKLSVLFRLYEGWNFNFDTAAVTFDTALL